MAWGRGGAGNIAQAQEAQERSTSSEDVEAQKPSVHPDAAEAASPPSTSSQTQQYAHKGRGGAGNWYSPAELSEQGTFASTSSATAAAVASAAAKAAGENKSNADIELPTARVGRGGAGNFMWGSSSDKKLAEEEEEQKKDELSARVAEDVERGLTRPGDVHLAVGGDRKMEDPAQVNYPVEAGLGL